MVVPVVRVGIVLVGVAKRLVGVHVPMAECRVIHPTVLVKIVVMQVVLVMRVPVVVADGEMGVRMPVPLGQVQPHPDGHE